MQAQSPAALVSALEFYVEAGIDCALAEEPQDRFAPPPGARPAPGPGPAPLPDRPPPAAPGGLPNAAASPEEIAAEARALARDAGSLDELERLLAAFDGCALKVSAKTLVFADGTPGGRVMIVGEAPGADEDRMGKPFVGRAGQLLDRMLAAIGLDRSQVYIANLVPWRPPGNRTPTPQEAAICRPFLDRQIELADPDFLVCLGAPATQALLGTKEGILRARGRWFPYRTGRREIRGLAMLHPAYLLRQPAQKRLAWRDLQALRRALDGRE
ncbi:MAG TPA: uracil-DNA glycosylase [Beijerinckiaceae bacterium]|nr:uracil-DNA glycosylase [Beijerinckiaceae bacterium]